MPFETTSEKLVALVTSVKAGDKYNKGSVTDVNIDESAGVKEELFAEEEVESFYNGLTSSTGFFDWTKRDAIEEIKTKVGFEKNKENTWIKKPKAGVKLNKPEAQKFFYQRLLLDSFKDEDVLVAGQEFQEELHGTSEQTTDLFGTASTDVSKDTVQDLWLFAKFNELQEEEKIPEDYVYKAFVGLVKKTITSTVPVTTQTIVNAVVPELLSKYSDKDIFVEDAKFKETETEPSRNENDFWLFAKYEELKKDKKIPNEFQYKSFVGVVQKVIQDAVEKKTDEGKAKIAEIGIDDIVAAVNDENFKQNKAAIKIQAAFRGKIGKEIAQGDRTEDDKNRAMAGQNMKLLKQIVAERIAARTPNPALPGSTTTPGGDKPEVTPEPAAAESALADEMRKMREEMQKMLGGKSGDAAQSGGQADGTRSVTYKYLKDNNYVSNGENHFLIPEITGREPGAVTQYDAGIPVFNYKDLNEFSQDADRAGQGKWDPSDQRLLSSLVCIDDGKSKRHCIVTSSVRGVSKTFISQAEFEEVLRQESHFYDWGLETAIKTTALNETLEILKDARKRYEDISGTEAEVESIDNEIAAIGERKALMNLLMTKFHEEYTADDRLSFLDSYNNLDIKLPEGIDFTKEEQARFDAAKSRTVVVGDSYDIALEFALKIDAAYEVSWKLKEVKTSYEDEIEALKKDQKKLIVGINDNDISKIKENIAAAGLAIEALTKVIDKFDSERPDDAESFKEKKTWSLTDALLDVVTLYDDKFLDEGEIAEIRESADKAIDISKDKPQDIADKLTGASVGQIDFAQKLANKEFGSKTGNRKEKLGKASDKEKEVARHIASCNYSHAMAESIDRSIEIQMIHGLDTFEVKSMAEDMAKAHAGKVWMYEGEKNKEKYAQDTKDVRKLLKSPLPHTPINGVGFHRPRGTSIVSVAFNYSGVGDKGELVGNTEAYPYIDGSFHCYIGCRVCKKDGMKMTVWENGKAVAEKEYKRGDTVIDQNTISFLDPKTQIYTHVEASPSALKAHLELMKKSGNPYPGSVETIMSQYEKMQIKVTSQVDNAMAGEEADIQTKVSIMHKGKTLSYNADTPKNTIAKKKVVKEAIDFDEKDNEVYLRPGFSIGEDSKVLDNQQQFVKMNAITLPDGGEPLIPYVKLSTNADGKIIHESAPYVITIDGDGKEEFKKLTSDIIAKQLRLESNMDDDDIKEQTAVLFDRAVYDCSNTKLILPLGSSGEEIGTKYEISTPTDFAGVGRGITGNEPSPSPKTTPKAVKLGNVGNVNRLPHIHESGIGQRVNDKMLVR
ncbi:MAG: hypothetical protein V4694_03475 [Pseudomonadota bacterium]